MKTSLKEIMGLLLLIIVIFLITDQLLYLLHVIDDDLPYTLHGVLHGFAKALPLCLFLALVDYGIIHGGIRMFPTLDSKVRAVLDFMVSSLFCIFICFIAHRYNWLWIDMDDTLCCNITVVLIIEGYFTQQQQMLNERKLALLNQEKAEYKYYALKNQLNPHFLFNSLNVLASLTRTDAQQAYGFVKKLASVYRFLLVNNQEMLIPLSQELKFMMAYAELERIRLGDGLHLTVEGQEKEDGWMVVPACLQIPVENAIKHNICNLANPLRIKVCITHDEISVSNNVQLRLVNENREHVGLNNLSNLCTELNIGMEVKNEGSTFCIVFHRGK